MYVISTCFRSLVKLPYGQFRSVFWIDGLIKSDLAGVYQYLVFSRFLLFWIEGYLNSNG